MRKKGRRFYFFLLLMLTIVLAILVFGEFQVQRRQSRQRDQYDREATFIAREIASEIGLQVKDYTQLVEALAKQVEAVGSLKTEVLQKMVTAQKAPFGHLSSAMFVGSPEGRSFALDPSSDQFGASTRGIEYTDRDYYKSVVQTDRTFIGPLRKGRAMHEPSVQIAAPIHDSEGRLLTIAMGSIKMDYFQSQIEEIMASAPGLKAVVMDQRGRVFVHPDKRATKELLDLSKYSIFDPTDHREGEVRMGTDETGVPIRAVIVPVSARDLQWRVAVYRPKADMKAMIAGIRRQLWAVVAAGLLPGLVLVALMILREFKGPSLFP
jgi:hypothetical protein